MKKTILSFIVSALSICDFAQKVVTAFSIAQGVSPCIFPVGYLAAVQRSFLWRRRCIQTDWLHSACRRWLWNTVWLKLWCKGTNKWKCYNEINAEPLTIYQQKFFFGKYLSFCHSLLITIYSLITCSSWQKLYLKYNLSFSVRPRSAYPDHITLRHSTL